MAKNQNKNTNRGLGDVIANITTTIGIVPCYGCKERQEKLNNLFPFKKPIKPNENDLEFLKDFFNWYKGIPIPIDKAEQIKEAELLWMKLFNVKTDACSTCGIEYQNAYIKDLKKLYDATMDN